MPYFDLNKVFPASWTPTFNGVWTSPEQFWKDYHESGLYTDDNSISEASAKLLFCLLSGKYGMSSIASIDIDQFKLAVFSTIYKYGPTWEARIKVQSQIRDLLQGEDLFTGTKQIYSVGVNPGTEISDEDQIQGINEQRSSRVKRGKIEAYTLYMEALKTDVTETFLGQFKKLFRTFVGQQFVPFFVTNIAEEDDEDA